VSHFRGASAPLALLSACGLAAVAPAASGDSLTPVRLQVSIAPVARLDRPLALTVAVSADPGVLDVRTAPLRMRVKLASECGGEFTHTPGTVLLDRELDPQPATGHAYQASAGGSGTPSAYGVQTVCVFLEEEGDNRQFASDTRMQVDVSHQCTAAADRLDRARTALAHAQAALRRARGSATRARRRRLVARQRAVVVADRRSASTACGQRVAL
jgi:hypothetical protein